MAFHNLWTPPAPSAAQVLEGVIASHRGLFKHYDLLKQDLATMLDKFKSLQASLQSFAPNMKNLTILGTIPFSYKGHTYNALIQIWIPYGYPSEAPNVSVIPTDELAVPKNHPFVSAQGHVDFKRLDFYWEPSYNTTFLVETLQQAFGNDPPLRRIPTLATNPPLSSSQHSYHNQSPHHSTSSNGSHLSTQTPPSHAKPTAASPATSPATAAYSVNPYIIPPPVTSSASQPPVGSNPQVRPSSSPGIPSSTSPSLLIDPYYNPNAMQGIHPTIPSSASPSIVASNPQGPSREETLELTQGLVMSVYHDMVEKKQKEQEYLDLQLHTRREEQHHAQTRLNDAVALSKKLQADEAYLLAEIQKLEAWIAPRAQESQGDIDYEAHAEPEDPFLRAAIPLHAKDLAIEDAQYHLEKALQNNTIDLKQFLKATRDLATEQYYHRAMLRKLNVRIPVQGEF